MKIKQIILLGAVVAFSSCSTAYRTGQTPDDVYYSPAPVKDSYASSGNDNGYASPGDDNGYVTPQTDNDINSYSYRNDEEGQNGSGSLDQNYTALAPVTLDLGYGYDPYGYSGLGYDSYYYNSFGNPFYNYDAFGLYNPYMYSSLGFTGLGLYNSPYGLYNPYGFYNPYMYNPYMFNLSYLGGSISSQYYPASGNSNISLYSGPRRYNLNAYTNTSSSGNSGVGVRGSGSIPTNTSPSSPTTIRRTTAVGNVIRRIFTPNRNNNTYVSPSNNNRVYYNSNNNRTYNNSENYRTFNNNNDQTPSRSYNNSSSESAPSNSGNSGGSAPVRTFRR